VIAEIVGAAANPRFAGDESYALHLDHRGVSIAARTQEGVRHARRTLAQLRAQYGSSLPCLTIEDAPAFATRGVMLDISRDRVPTMEHLLATVDLLASLKINHLQLYTEHTFAYRGHEDAWRDASPVTPDEVRALDEHCRAQSIDLAANQNCFGHLANWLRLPRYAPLAETHGDWVFEFREERFPRSGPFSLCPTDQASLTFVEDLLGQLLPCFSSGLVNIGCDETFDVGFGRSRAEVERRGPGGRASVYMDFVNQIAGVAHRHRKRPMFWADIALSHPESLRATPEDMIGLAWGYEPDSDWARWCSLLRDAGREVWVCPGTSSWRSITGRTTERRANLSSAAREGAAHGASGYLVTDWGDSGHHQQWPIALAALAEAADAAWTGGAEGYDARAASLHAFGDRTLSMAPWLDRLGDADEPIRAVAGPTISGSGPVRLRNSSALFNDLHLQLAGGTDQPAKALIATGAKLWEDARDRIRSLGESQDWQHASDYREEIDLTLATALLAANKGILRRTHRVREDKEWANVAAEILNQHRRLWLRRSRPGGLESSCRHYQRIVDDLRGTPS
jgi:hypothetical protein